jgi:hypothetical protein
MTGSRRKRGMVNEVMHVFDKRKMQLLVSIFGSVGVAGLVLATVTSASAAPSRAAASTAGPAFALRGTAVGGIKTIQTGQTLTFLFRETNKGPGSAPEDLVLTKVTNAKVVGGLTCVLPNGSAINSDGFSCEPGILSPGQSSSSVITTNVTGGSGSVASARLCLDNESIGVRGPCTTVSIKIA